MSKLFVLVLVLMSFGASAQNVGINNTDPQTALDISGKLRIRSTGFDVTAGGTITLLNSGTSYYSLNGNPGSDFTVVLPAGVKGTFLVVENATYDGYSANVTGLTSILPGKSKLFIYGDTGWVLAHESEESQLEKITEGGNTGWRLLTENPDYHGNIGQKAMDLSVSTLGANSIYGATGEYAVALGRDVISEGESAIAIGKDVKANGLAATSLGSGNEVNSDYSTALGNDNDINTSHGAVAIGSNNELSNANNSTALGSANIVNANAASAIGESNTVSGIAATAIGSNNNTEGDYAASIGFANAAIGNNSLAIGNSNAASNENAIAMGNESEALGVTTTAMGTSWASSFLSVSMGRYSDTIVGSNRNTWVDTDPLLTLGNGSNYTNLKNAMTVYKNGTLQLENHTTTPANSTNKFYVQNNEPYFGTSGLKSQLEKITEGGNTGWRLAGRNPNNYGDIGIGAIDFSHFAFESTDRGATGEKSVAMGVGTKATHFASTAMGDATTASQFAATALGHNTTASGESSTAMGRQTTASGLNSTAMGWGSTAGGHSSTAMGWGTISNNEASTAIGRQTTASGLNSTAMGFNSTASGENSVVMGVGTNATHFASTAMGDATTASQFAATALGFNTIASGESSTAMGRQTTASGLNSTAMGFGSTAGGHSSTAMGRQTTASGLNSTAMGFNSTASGENSVAMGFFSTSSGHTSLAANNSIAAGHTSLAANNSIAAGLRSASFNQSQALGENSFATGNGHVGSTGTNAAGIAGGGAFGVNASALGEGTHAWSFSSTSLGRYNDGFQSTSNTNTWVNTDPLFIIGNGTSNTDRKNAMTVYKNGTLQLENHTTTPANSTNKFYVQNNEPYFGTSGLKSQLEKITEGGNTGWRLAGRDPNNYGDIGNNAVDLSYSLDPTSQKGAINTRSFAAGYETTAGGPSSTVMGIFSSAEGDRSTAFGNQTTAFGASSTAMGNNTKAIGASSTAMGYNTKSLGDYGAVSMGHFSTAAGDVSFAMGDNVVAKSYESVAFGRYNDSIATSNPTSWVDSDPLFIIGNGTSDTDRKNAMTVYKNANTEISGYTRLGLASEGAPIIKTKKITSTSHADHNGEQSISHGLSASKILSVSVLIEWNTNQFAPPAYSQSANLLYNYYINDGNIVIRNDTPSGNCLICNKPVKLFITYEE